MLVYMFRELIRYATQSITQSGQCSPLLQSTLDFMRLSVPFWSGNVLNHLLLAEVPPSLCEAKKILEIVGSFLAVSCDPITIFSVLGFDVRTAKTLTVELNQALPICVVPTFNYEDLYKVLAGPAIKILDRYDLHSILRFFLMKLRTALDTACLNNLPELRKVSPHIYQSYRSPVIFHYLEISVTLFEILPFPFYTDSGKLHNAAYFVYTHSDCTSTLLLLMLFFNLFSINLFHYTVSF